MRTAVSAALPLAALCLGIVGMPTAAGGAPGSSPPPLLRWRDVLAAVEAHPALRAASAEADVAAAAVTEVRQFPNPVLAGSLGRSEAVAGSEREAVWGLELMLPLPSPGARGGAIAAAEAERAAAAADLEAERREVLARLRETYLRALHDQQSLESLAATATQLGRLVEVARRRVEAGEARPMELDRLRIEAARVDLEIARARREAEARRQVLDLWLGSRLPEDYRVEGDLTHLPALPAAADPAAAAAGHPRTAALDEQARAAAARLREARGARLPALAVGGFWERELDARAVGGRLELSLPLWNWNGGAIARARAAEAAARHRRDLVATALEADLRESRVAALVAYERARGLRREILPRAAATTAALETMYRVGEAGLTDLLVARRELIEIEAELLRSCLEARLARLRLLTLSGEDPDD